MTVTTVIAVLGDIRLIVFAGSQLIDHHHHTQPLIDAAGIIGMGMTAGCGVNMRTGLIQMGGAIGGVLMMRRQMLRRDIQLTVTVITDGNRLYRQQYNQ